MLFKSATSRNIFSVAACGVFTTIAAAAVLFAIAYHNIRVGSIEQMRQIAAGSAGEVERSIQGGLQIVADLKATLQTMRDSGRADRTQADQLLKTLVENNNIALGIWTGWEPNAFDSKDSEYVGKPGHDTTGRYVPYLVRGGGRIIHQPLTSYTERGVGDYYILAHDAQRITVLEPYIYAIDGKDVMMTTIANPVIDDGKTVGVVGMDISLAATNQALAAIRPMGTGFLGLVTEAGNIISHPDATLAGKTLKDAGSKTADWDKLIANPGTEREVSAPDGRSYFAIAYPVKLTKDFSWYAIVEVPRATVFAELYDMMWSAAAVTAVAAILLGFAGWLIARRFVARINNVIGETGEIANGNFNVALKDRDVKDEIGDLSRSLGILLESNRQKVRLEAEAKASNERQEADRKERLTLDKAREDAIKFAVDELGEGLSQLSNGNMTTRLEHAFTDSLDEIRRDFNMSVEKLQAALLSFSQNATIIEAGSEEIRSGTNDLARRTEQQAASVEETAAALEEITTSVKDSTSRAEEAGAMVNRTRQGAERSGEIVRNAVEAMTAIKQSSQSISNIIGVIDDIAFQTNLLALNAGVEAARAGDAGKGFAVVAQEVRELAQRSATAAKEIKTLILSSGGEVERGVMLVGQTGDALQAIVGEVQQIDVNVQAIVQAAREQLAGLQEINTAVNEMDMATQKNAAMVEQSSAASHTLATEVSSLSAQLKQFNLVQRPATLKTAPVTAYSAAARSNSGPVALAASPSPARTMRARIANGLRVAAATAAAPLGHWEEF